VALLLEVMGVGCRPFTAAYQDKEYLKSSFVPGKTVCPSCDCMDAACLCHASTYSSRFAMDVSGSKLPAGPLRPARVPEEPLLAGKKRSPAWILNGDRFVMKTARSSWLGALASLWSGDGASGNGSGERKGSCAFRTLCKSCRAYRTEASWYCLSSFVGSATSSTIGRYGATS
jgi:hypothetical protein